MDSEKQQIIAIPLEEYKELLIIKGKYEEYSNSRLQILQKETKNTGPFSPTYKITC